MKHGQELAQASQRCASFKHCKFVGKLCNNRSIAFDSCSATNVRQGLARRETVAVKHYS